MAKTNKTGKTPLFSDEECAWIARHYDGTTDTIDALLREYSARGAKRHNIVNAAKRGGYRTARQRKDWSPSEDEWLRENWHKYSPEEVAAHLGRSATSVTVHKKRLGIRRYDGPDLTIHDLEAALRIDHRLWLDFIEKGWLKAWHRKRQGNASPITRVSVESLHAFLRDHPEVVDYRNAGTYAVGILELARLRSRTSGEVREATFDPPDRQKHFMMSSSRHFRSHGILSALVHCCLHLSPQ